MQDNKSGSVITAPLSLAGKLKCDEIWQITPSDQVIPGARWVPNLAPSATLFNKYSFLWKGRPEEEWWPEYEKAFKEEMTSRTKISQLRELWNKVSQGKVIALICSCPDDRYCHRRLVAEVIAKSGIKAYEYPALLTRDGEIEQPSLF